jgi:hypothetical protein
MLLSSVTFDSLPRFTWPVARPSTPPEGCQSGSTEIQLEIPRMLVAPEIWMIILGAETAITFSYGGTGRRRTRRVHGAQNDDGKIIVQKPDVFRMSSTCQKPLGPS